MKHYSSLNSTSATSNIYQVIPAVFQVLIYFHDSIITKLIGIRKIILKTRNVIRHTIPHADSNSVNLSINRHTPAIHYLDAYYCYLNKLYINNLYIDSKSNYNLNVLNAFNES